MSWAELGLKGIQTLSSVLTCPEGFECYPCEMGMTLLHCLTVLLDSYMRAHVKYQYSSGTK